MAIDEEMTGISLPGTGRPRKDETPSQLYATVLKLVPERYSIIQWGICLFHYENNKWNARKYNFYMFPSSLGGGFGGRATAREVVLNPSAVAFLHQHNMSFDLWSKSGVPYLPKDAARETIQACVKKQREQLYEIQQRIAASSSGTLSSPPVSVESTLRRRVQLTRSEDVEFFAQTMALLREWLDAAHINNNNPTGANPPDRIPNNNGQNNTVNGGENASSLDRYTTDSRHCLLLPPCNSFLRRALYENIEKEYPTLILEKCPEQPDRIRVLRLNEAEQREREEALRKEAWEDMIQNKVGMWRVFAALTRVCNGYTLPKHHVLFAETVQQVDFSLEEPEDLGLPTERKIPLVVHNGLMDILFLMTHFHSSTLPATLAECKALISGYFPIIYDTKIISTECTTIWNNEQSNLANLFQKVVHEYKGGQLLSQLHVVEPEPEDGEVVDSAADDQEHEAAYDAYVTGAIYIGLCQHIKEKFQESDSSSSASEMEQVGHLPHLLNSAINGVRSRYGRNKLYQISIYTLDLEEQRDGDDADPLKRGMLPDTTYRVSNIDRAVNTMDIVNCLRDKTDKNGRQIHFDIVWVDDTTFMVAVKCYPDDNGGNGAPSVDEDNEEEKILREHGEIVNETLCNRFNNDVMTLKEFYRRKQSAKNAGSAAREEMTWMSRILDLFGLECKRKKEMDSDKFSTSKRRRMN